MSSYEKYENKNKNQEIKNQEYYVKIEQSLILSLTKFDESEVEYKISLAAGDELLVGGEEDVFNGVDGLGQQIDIHISWVWLLAL